MKSLTSFDFHLSLDKTLALLSAGLVKMNHYKFIFTGDMVGEGLCWGQRQRLHAERINPRRDKLHAERIGPSEGLKLHAERIGRSKAKYFIL